MSGPTTTTTSAAAGGGAGRVHEQAPRPYGAVHVDAAHLWPGLQPRARPAPLSDLWVVGTPPTGALIGALLHLCGPGLLLALVGAAAAAWADVAFTRHRWPIRTTTPHHPPRAGAR